MTEPFEAIYWNGMQLIAWVFLGDRVLVKDLADEADHEKIWVWKEATGDETDDKMVKVPRPRPSSFTLMMAADERGKAAFSSLKAAKAAVLTAFQEGDLNILGLKNGKGERLEIPESQRADLVFLEDRRGLYLSHGRPIRIDAVRWYDLKIRRANILEIWPDPLLEKIPQKKGFSSAALTKAYKERVKSWHKDKTPPTRDDDVSWARKEFGEGVPVKRVHKIRVDHAPQKWTRPGRRPKKETGGN